MLKNIAILLGLTITIAIGYYLFVIEDQSILSSNVTVSTSAQQQSREFLLRLQDLQDTNLQTNILRDPRFTNRVDYRRSVPVLQVGRENPFLPIE
jgi:hypothetical protein